MRATILVSGVLLVAVAMTAGCGDDVSNGGGDGGVPDLAVTMSGADMAGLVNGCPSLTLPVTTPDGGAGGDTWASYAQGFYAMYCTRCHASTLTGAARNGAPDGYDWDVEAAVDAHLAEIRNAVGVGNFMPANPPNPTCDERRRIVRWIDADAP